MDAADDETTRALAPPPIGLSPPARSVPLIEAGELVGRYRVLRQLGAGGMGRVYLAHDPKLAREVALKVVEVRGTRDRRTAHARLLREAQALAQLSHPAVVTVFDAGAYGPRDDAVYLAMEFVEGAELQQWSAAEPRTWQETLSLLIRAGRGLEAAHRAGIVHRDFKPSNVMIGVDGRVRVVDFGLARGTISKWSRESGAGDTSDGSIAGAAASGSLGIELTQSGNVMGTPAFMAPEQFLGDVQDGRSDQFSFCVTAHRLLYDRSPFPARDVGALRRAVLGGVPPTRPSDVAVPARVWQAIARGLSRDPADRYPSMTSLLAELEAAVSNKRTVVAIGVLGGAALAVAIGLWSSAPPEQSCDGAAVRVRGAWGRARAEAIGERFGRDGKPYAAASAKKATAALGVYFERYSVMHRDVCERGKAASVDKSPLDAQFSCLDRGFAQASALVDVFASGDDEVVQRAPKSVLGLPRLERCLTDARTAALAGQEEAEAALARGRALSLGGRYADTLEAIAPFVAQVDIDAPEPGAGPRLFYLQGEALEHLARTDEAVAAYQTARQGAASAGDDELEFLALAGLCSARGGQADFKGALKHARQAEAILARIGETGVLPARLALLRGGVLRRSGDLDGASAQFQVVVKVTEGRPDTAVMRSAALHNLATVLGARGHFEEAEAAFTGSLALALEQLGPEHPTVGAHFGSRGVTRTHLGRFEEGRRDLERALAIQTAALGPDHVEVARVHAHFGVHHLDAGRPQEALKSLTKALQIKRAALGENHPSVAFTENNLGDALISLGRPAEAIAHLGEAARLLEAARGQDAPSLLFPMAGLARAHLESDNVQLASEYAARALALVDKEAFDDYVVGELLVVATRISLAAGDEPSVTRLLAVRAVNSLERSERPAEERLAEARQLLASLNDGRAHPHPAHSTRHEDVRD